MDPKLLELLMKAGEFTGRDDVPEDVKELLRQLAGAVATGGEPPVEAPASEMPPEAPAAEAPPDEEPPAMAGMNEHSNVPANRAAPANVAPGAPAARVSQSLSAAEKDANAAAELARKRLVLEENAYREALFRSAPDVFPEATPKAREPYKTAKPDEIERHIAAVRARKETQTPPANGRAREIQGQPREPAPGTSGFAKNEGGMVVRAGGRVVSS